MSKIFFVAHYIMGEIMRNYYLFIIREEYYDLYHDNPHLLYKALSFLFRIRLNNFSFGLSIYDQLCEPIEVDYLSDYLNYHFHLSHNKYKYLVINQKHKENSIIFIRPSYIHIYTNVNIPHVMSLFYLYQRRIFVIDIDNQDYFWLKNYHQSLLESV